MVIVVCSLSMICCHFNQAGNTTESVFSLSHAESSLVHKMYKMAFEKLNSATK
jgi:hypothetical protein